MERMQPVSRAERGVLWIDDLPWPAHLLGAGPYHPNRALQRALGFAPGEVDAAEFAAAVPPELDEAIGAGGQNPEALRELTLSYKRRVGPPVVFRSARVIPGEAGSPHVVLLAGGMADGGTRTELLARITAVISHDLNNVFTISQSYLELLRRHRPSEVQREEYLRRVGRSITRGIGLNEMLQTLSAGHAVPMAPCHLDEVVESLRDLLPRILAPGPVWSFAIEEDLPPVFSHPVILTRLVIDLCLNATHLWPDAGELQLRVRRARSEGPAAMLRAQPVGRTRAVPHQFEAYLLPDSALVGSPPHQIDGIVYGGEVSLDVSEEMIVALLAAPRNLRTL